MFRGDAAMPQLGAFLDLRTDEVAADSTDGVLTLRVPRPDETMPKRIPINDPRQLTERT